jgi:hypothetical protein
MMTSIQTKIVFFNKKNIHNLLSITRHIIEVDIFQLHCIRRKKLVELLKVLITESAEIGKMNGFEFGTRFHDQIDDVGLIRTLRNVKMFLKSNKNNNC